MSSYAEALADVERAFRVRAASAVRASVSADVHFPRYAPSLVNEPQEVGPRGRGAKLKSIQAILLGEAPFEYATTCITEFHIVPVGIRYPAQEVVFALLERDSEGDPGTVAMDRTQSEARLAIHGGIVNQSQRQRDRFLGRRGPPPRAVRFWA